MLSTYIKRIKRQRVGLNGIILFGTLECRLSRRRGRVYVEFNMQVNSKQTVRNTKQASIY